MNTPVSGASDRAPSAAVEAVPVKSMQREDEEFFEKLTRTNNELANLQRELARANMELEAARKRAQRADQMKSAFLATLSHELRTPLNSIIGFAGILLQGLPGPLNAEQAKQLRIVQSSARHLVLLVNDTLDISKIEAGELAIHAARFDLRVSVAKVIAVVEPLAVAKGLGLHAVVAPEAGEMIGDARRVEQVLLNLLGNAVKFTTVGDVRLSVRHVGQSVQMRVTDSGVGIAATDIDTIFEPFQQLDDGLARNHDGTGLGLSISARLARLMGGSIEVASEPEAGSTFIFSLPQGTGPRD